MTTPSAQLIHDLRSSLTSALRTGRPLLHHLNADSSWLLQLPRPGSDNGRGGRYNILLDPWFRGAERYGAAWFSAQWHAEPSRVQSVREVRALLRAVEAAARGQPEPADGQAAHEAGVIDAVVVAHEFMDHCHRQTLEEVEPGVPVFAPAKAAALIRSWSHFSAVHEIPVFASSPPSPPSDALPPWLQLARLQSANDPLHLHSGLLFAFGLSGCSEPRECIVYSPHGLHPSALAHVVALDPPLRTLCLIHGLHEVSLALPGARVNLGARAGVETVRALGAKYWVPTHDEVKAAVGVVAWLLRRRVLGVEEALGEAGAKVDGVKFVDVKNGESLVLE